MKKKHSDWNIPSGVYVPIWFDGYWNGARYGHVAIYKDGVVWSSPFTNKGTHDRIGSIAEVERIYGMKYIGWSEDIGGTRVIEQLKEVNVPTIQNQPNWRARFNRLHRQLVGNWDMSDAVFRSIVGNDAWKIVESWSDHQNANQALSDQVLGELARKDKWQQQIYDLQAQVKALGSRPTKAQLDEATKKANDLAKAMDSAQAQAAEERKKAQEAQSKAAALEEEQAKAKREAENFWTALINTVRGWVGGGKS
ncbi:hypothetical protein [Dietzia maris]|uniref:hypothetical protein n=1 Tax=Dietzia maris TaxID=37915 RepID=UPI0037C4F9DD